ncbi:MAG: cell division ATP-binding protein FtsE [Deltaproteobacteria bacterium]|nr:MAG: cell division ATP-binding protein FtsE [Deltaproteobacteria bacterium]
MIQMFHVYKSYLRNTNALEDINLRVEKGEFVFLTGPSGAGKTTLLKLLFCAERATRGQILVNGRNIARIRESSIPYLRRNIGVVFQDFKLLNNRTAFENVALALEVIGARRKEIKSKVWKTLKMVGLQHKINTKPLRLAGGEQQRIAIARALVNDPAILLADEPTGNLDPDLTIEIINLLKDINARGTTVMIATHNQALVEKLHKRSLVLDKGKLLN